jgi:hypothetical protein
LRDELTELQRWYFWEYVRAGLITDAEAILAAVRAKPS